MILNVTRFLTSAVCRAAAACKAKKGEAYVKAYARYRMLRAMLRAVITVNEADIPGKALAAAVSFCLFSVLPLMVAGCL